MIHQTETEHFTENRLESLIIQYQNARHNEQYTLANELYLSICKVYDPYSFINKWYVKYKHLYNDSLEDFTQDYLQVFIKTLNAWKPKDQRSVSKHNGKGDFKNYFWGALQYFYINQIKAEAASKKNIVQQCPECSEWYSPLSSHILESHSDLLWQYFKKENIVLDHTKGCIFCTAFKKNRSKESDPEMEMQRLKKHILSAHSHILFEYFHVLHPNIMTVNQKNASIYFQDDSDEESNIYDIVPSTGAFNDFLNLPMSTIQQSLIKKILNGSNDTNYDPNVYKCSLADFEKELEDLKQKMILCGVEH